MDKLKLSPYKFLSLLILAIGFLVITAGTSNWYQRYLSNEMKQKGRKVYGTIEYLDCQTNNLAIIKIEGSPRNVRLKSDCSTHSIGDSLLFYNYKDRYVLESFEVPLLKIIVPLILGILVIFIGIQIRRRITVL